MLKLFFSFFLLSVLSLQSATIELDYKNAKFENFTIAYVLDKDSLYNIHTIQKQEFTPILNMHAFNGNRGCVWYKMSFKNTTQIEQKLLLHNDFAYFSREITIYEFSNHKLIDQNRYDILAKDKAANPLTGATLIYKLKLAPNEEKTIYMQNTLMVSNLVKLNVYNEKNSVEALMNHLFYSTFIIAIMFTLALYNATLYLFNRRKEFLLYALYMLTPATGLLYKYGLLFSYFHLYGENTYWFNITAILMPAFLIFFVKQVLTTHKMAKHINMLLNIMLFIIAVNIASAFIFSLTFAMEAFKLMFLLTTATLIYLSIYLFKHKHPLAKIFALAYGFYIVGLIITILAMSGLIEMNFFTFHSGGIGIIMEGLLFSYLMHHNIKILEQKINFQREKILRKNKKEQLGEMISAITHDWKQPLSRITSITSLLMFKISKKEAISNTELDKQISLIDANIHFLSDTIDDFKDFFNQKSKIQKCNMTSLIQNVVQLVQNDSLSNNISITTDLSFKEDINTSKSELMHILLNILQNSKEAFKQSKKKVKIIKIIGYNKEEKLYIDIVDNAGGIKKETIPFIFDENYTTKEDKEGHGLGLYLSKVLMHEHLKGSIEATNIRGGTMFRIIL